MKLSPYILCRCVAVGAWSRRGNNGCLVDEMVFLRALTADFVYFIFFDPQMAQMNTDKCLVFTTERRE